MLCCRGYACCHSCVKQSYCVGAAGAAAAADAAEQLAANMEAKAAEHEARRKDSKLVGHKPAADVWGEAAEEQELDQQKVAEALRRQEEVGAQRGWPARTPALLIACLPALSGGTFRTAQR